MIRFSASEPEIIGLLRFLERRAKRLIPMDAAGRLGSLLFVPLTTENRDDLRPRRTPRTLVRALRDKEGASLWGVRLATDANHPYSVSRDSKTGRYIVDPEASRLVVFAFGPVLPEQTDASEAAPERRREGIIEIRDWTEESPPATPPEEDLPLPTSPSPKGVVLLPQTLIARDLVERCARRLRRRGALVGNRWHVPPHLPEDEDETDADDR